MKECPDCGQLLTADALRCSRCGAPPSGEVLIDGRYVLQGELGRGAMGTVYRATDVTLNRLAALKFIGPDGARDSRFVERFRREASALASVRHHNVVHVFTMGTHGGTPFYAMEYVEGRDLDAIIREHKAHGTMVPVYAALTILKQLAHGLQAVHRAGIVHRDVKPGNVVIEDRSGRPVLLDFGLARPAARDASSATVTAGTAPYMAPEQIDPREEDDELGPRTDVYGLGCTAFELLTGRPPFIAENLYAYFQKHLHEEAPPISRFRPDLAVLDAVIQRALEKSPAARYESAETFAEALDAASARWREVGTPLPPPYTAPPAPLPSLGSAEGRQLRVLIVDDDPMFRRIARRAARLATRDKHVEVIEATSGIRALTACVERPPDLVILDYDMPGPNGIATLSEMRALPGAARAAVLVVSSSVGDIERWRFSVLGVKDFLDKPVHFEVFVRTIARIADLLAQDTRPDSGDAPQPRVQSLPREVFLALLAVGWADGKLDDAERDAVFAAAEEARLSDDDLRALREAARTRVELDDLHVDRLRTVERAYVYAVARWIALVDGDLSERETAMLRVLAFALQMNTNTQTTVESLVGELIADASLMKDRKAVLTALRREVARRYPTEPAKGSA